MRIRTNLAAAAIAICAMAAAGCSSGGGEGGTTTTTSGTTGSTAAKKSLTITMIAKSSTNPVFLSAQTGANDAAKDLTAKTGVEVKIDWETPAQEDGQKQASNIENAINSGTTDAILMSCSDANKVTNAINDAVAKGIPVMTFDSDAPQSKRFTYYGANDKTVGTEVMDELGAQMGGKGVVAILAGNQDAPNLQARAQAVKDEAKAKFPGIQILKVVNHIETPKDATQAVEDEMKANPQITGWAMVGGWPLFATSLLTELDPSKVKVVAVDALPAELDYVEKGIAPVLLAQPTYLWGYVSVNMIFDKIINKKDIPAFNEMPLVKVDKENLGQWAHQLQDWGFQGIDPKFLAMKVDPNAPPLVNNPYAPAKPASK